MLYGAMARTRLGSLKRCRPRYISSTDLRIVMPVNFNSRRRSRAVCVLASSAPAPTAAATFAAAAVASAAASNLGRFSIKSAPTVAIPTASATSLSSNSNSSPTTAVSIHESRDGSNGSSSSSGGGGGGSNPAGAVGSIAAATSPDAAASSSSSSSSPSLEGTPVPWASLGSSLDLIQQRFRIGGATFRLLAPRDVDAVMDMYLEKGLLDSDPYWTRAWPSAIALAATLMQRPELVAGKVVADLGAGLGLAGMAAAMAGAKEVVLLDREPAALQCALLSAAATGLDSDSDFNEDPDLDLESLRDASTSLPAHSHQLPQQQRGGGGRVEPLPADELPSYAALQLTPPYRHLVRPLQGHEGKLEVSHEQEGDGLLQVEQGQDEQSHQYGKRPPPLSPSPLPLPSPSPQQRQHEWKMLMALARALDCNPDNSQKCDPAESQVSCSGRDSGDGGSRGAAAATPVSYKYQSPSPSLLRSSSETVAEKESRKQRDSSGCDGGCSSGGSSGSSSVLRAHVFDWTAPPVIEQLLPPTQNTLQLQQRGRGRQSIVRQRRFDVVLACDVLYEDAAVGPIAGLMPLLLEPDGGRLLLADPPNRTVRNRERFLAELRSGPLRLSVEECSLQQCEVSKLDNEMAGGLAPTAETVPVQFLVFRSSLGNDTVGIKDGGAC